MHPLADLPASRARSLKILLCDIDGTLTESDGRIPASVFGALEAARAGGLLVVPVTGRPAGWCDLILRTWPVDAVVGENGGFYAYREGGRPRLVHAADSATRARDRSALDELWREVHARFPAVALASDQPYRLYDLAVDFCEDVPPRPWSEIEAIAAFLASAGCHVKVSSIHINAWFGDFDKGSCCRRLLAERYGLDLEAPGVACYFGDSPNDAPMFRLVPDSVGVANVLDFEGRMDHLPAWRCEGRSAAGFVEGVGTILHLRTGAPPR